MSETVTADFASLMSKAAELADPPAEEAPYGWMTDPDGTRRPKKSPGRPRKSPTLDELKEAKAAEPEAPKPEDRPPDGRRRPHRRTREPRAPKEPVVQFREGVIERGINKLYRRAGKMVKVWDEPTGDALIAITRKDDPEDSTVGECWENLARRNPRIRAFLMKIISGGDWGALVMVHAPVGLALFMRFRLGERLPMGKLVEAFISDTDGDGEAPAAGTPFDGLTMPDMEEMKAAAMVFAERMVNGDVPGVPGIPEVPPAFRRQQPKRSSRAERAGTR